MGCSPSPPSPGVLLTCSITSSWECSVSKSLTSSCRTWGCRSWWQVLIYKQAKGNLTEERGQVSELPLRTQRATVRALLRRTALNAEPCSSFP